MTDPVRELKVRAGLLLKRVRAREPESLERLRVLPEYRQTSSSELAEVAATLQRRHCLSSLARESGFSGWSHARAVLSGEREVEDFGTLLCPARCGSFLNHWYRSYEVAAAQRAATGGYLLAYRKDFLVVTREYITTLGLDPDAPEWERMGHDWARPRDCEARTRLYGGLITAES